MNIKQGEMMGDRMVRPRIGYIFLSVFLIFQVTVVNAEGLYNFKP